MTEICLRKLSKAIDLEHERDHPGAVTIETQYEEMPPQEPSLADLLLQEIWDPERILNLLRWVISQAILSQRLVYSMLYSVGQLHRQRR
jgi:hypothetical protein